MGVFSKIIQKGSPFLSNLIIAASVTLIFVFLEQTPAGPLVLNALLRLLAFTLAVLFNLRNHPHTSPGLVFDFISIIIAVSVATSLRSSTGRILANLCLFAVLLVMTILLVSRYHIISYAAPILFGLLLVSAGEGVADMVKSRVQRRIIAEKQDAEFGVVRHLAHNLKPGVQIVRSPLVALCDFIRTRGLAGEELSQRMDGSVETVGEALAKAITALAHLTDIIDNTRKLVVQEISADDFCEEDVRRVLEEEVFPLHRGRWRLTVQGSGCRISLHRDSFVEAMHNLLRNAKVHGFPDDPPAAEVVFHLHETRKHLVIEYLNNGRPFPENLSPADFLTFGKKGAESRGEGLGGAWIAKMLAAHGGSFDIIRDGHPVHFRIALPKEKRR